LRKESATQTAIAKRHAESAVKLMILTVTRKIAQEEAKRGLIIVYAKYGNLEKDDAQELVPNKVPVLVGTEKKEEFPPAIDVTVALQNLVEDSKLHLHPGSKSSLLGFYDPCVGEDKQLYIRYLFKDRMHEVKIDDTDAIGLPLESHRIRVS